MRHWMRRACALLLCTLTLAVPSARTERWDVWAVEETEEEQLLALSDEEREAMEELSESMASAADYEADLSDLECNPNLPGHVINILLLGVDNRSVSLESGRSDAVIICSINKVTGAVTLTSIARDTAVEVPGFQTFRRINLAFKLGSQDGDIARGAQLAMKTVNRNFGMNISRYVVVNIHGLADIIEALGGMELELTAAEASAINYELFEKEPMDSNAGRKRLKQENGVQHLDGMQAVTYGRIRNLKGQSDLHRNGRQRVLLEALLKQVMADMNLIKLMNVIETALPYGRTNLTLEEMVTLGMDILSGETMSKLSRGEPIVEQFAIPMEKHYRYRAYGNVALLYIDEEQMDATLRALHELIYGSSYAH